MVFKIIILKRIQIECIIFKQMYFICHDFFVVIYIGNYINEFKFCKIG